MNTIIGISSSSSVNSFFSATTPSQDEVDYVSGLALGRGITSFTNGNYADAVKQFQSAIAMSPTSDNASNAYEYMGEAYTNLNDTADAIKTYKNAISVFPQADSFHLALGDIYYGNGQLSDAQSEYEKAVQLNPSSADDAYSLGQVYLVQGQLSQAKAQFTKVTQLSPTSAAGYYGLGQVLRQSGDDIGAVAQLNKAISVDKTFTNSYLELGETYADMGDTTDATNQLNVLQGMNSSLAGTLSSYMAQAANPQIETAYSTSGFNIADGPGTAVSSLAPSLSSPSGTATFTMDFVFSKPMDQTSVQNIANWQISREYGKLISDNYNFGMPMPATEVSLPTQPTSAVYNSQNNSAEVTFSISQNAEDNGTLDPSHVAFQFNGTDANGMTMDPTANEYSGFSKVV